MLTYYILMRRGGLLLTVTTALLAGCTTRSTMESALNQAGSNRTELEAVLNHYRDTDINPQKLRAAEFLIENMPAHYSDAGGRTVPDAQVISSDYLIENIDKTYDQWKNTPWSTHLVFDEYLEWLLPYKMAQLQELDHWRDTLYARFGVPCLKERSLYKNDAEYLNVVEVADGVRDYVNRHMSRKIVPASTGVSLLLDFIHGRPVSGTTSDYSLMLALTLRSMGIPVVLDETPVGPRDNASTQWVVILSDRGDQLTTEWDFTTTIGEGFFPYERGPKVYRNTYAMNRDREEYLRKAKYKYPFKVNRQDVTRRYFLTSNLNIPVDNAVRRHLKDKYVYIASAVRDDSNPWQIVDYAKLNKGQACFKDMGREVLYTVMGYDGTGLVPITDPFILHKDGSMEYVSADTISSPSLDKWKNYAL